MDNFNVTAPNNGNSIAQELIRMFGPFAENVESWAIRECASDKAVGEFGSGSHEYIFVDGSKLVFTDEPDGVFPGEVNRKVSAK
ncbi:hypothetical protein [Pseudomonas sp. ENNP23]|uniref:hypothetical protein n=1 Tax=Pseudomonas sp. ENNP23 TaxID=1535636 RepID=UPI00084A89AB|nr:hypothetical protein [Pseudomonas sp. ENNP23]OEC61303.1 hypothetical protein A9G05_04135 [Pseudomonas sp. ENNP23]